MARAYTILLSQFIRLLFPIPIPIPSIHPSIYAFGRSIMASSQARPAQALVPFHLSLWSPRFASHSGLHSRPSDHLCPFLVEHPPASQPARLVQSASLRHKSCSRARRLQVKRPPSVDLAAKTGGLEGGDRSFIVTQIVQTTRAHASTRAAHADADAHSHIPHRSRLHQAYNVAPSTPACARESASASASTSPPALLAQSA